MLRLKGELQLIIRLTKSDPSYIDLIPFSHFQQSECWAFCLNKCSRRKIEYLNIRLAPFSQSSLKRLRRRFLFVGATTEINNRQTNLNPIKSLEIYFRLREFIKNGKDIRKSIIAHMFSCYWLNPFSHRTFCW